LSYRQHDSDVARIWFGANARDRSAEIDAKYAVYLERQEADVAAYRRDEALVLPDDLDYGEIAGLSNEVRQKLSGARPRTLGQAGRLDGVTPAALTLLASHMRRSERTKRRGARG
jgi:tRNA uridine 5-carboxymethylaminomethyl modification enzyme